MAAQTVSPGKNATPFNSAIASVDVRSLIPLDYAYAYCEFQSLLKVSVLEYNIAELDIEILGPEGEISMIEFDTTPQYDWSAVGLM